MPNSCNNVFSFSSSTHKDTTMAGRQQKASGTVGRFAGGATAVDPDMIDENGEKAFLSTH